MLHQIFVRCGERVIVSDLELRTLYLAVFIMLLLFLVVVFKN